MKRAVVAAIVVLAGAAALWYWLAHKAEQGPKPYLGFVEAESMLIAPKQTGRLVELHASEGDDVASGDRLYSLDADDETAAVAEAEAKLAQARAQLADLRQARQRPAEIEALEAQRDNAKAALDLSRSELDRYQQLFKRGVSSESRLDQARTAFRRDQSALAEIEKQIDAARLPGRENEIAAAESAVQAGSASLARARTALAERTVAAPKAGRILDVIYRQGEIVPAGQPVLELLPPENIIVRFYVPETEVATLRRGGRVAISCDGCASGLSARISYIASESEFTPPVIFSREERAKLVFMVEARPETASPGAAPPPVLRPGLPVEVRPR